MQCGKREMTAIAIELYSNYCFKNFTTEWSDVKHILKYTFAYVWWPNTAFVLEPDIPLIFLPQQSLSTMNTEFNPFFLTSD